MRPLRVWPEPGCWALLEAGPSPRAYKIGPDWTRRGGRVTEGEGTQGALLMSSVFREPINMVMTIGNKADGILVGIDGKYSSMAASFR